MHALCCAVMHFIQGKLKQILGGPARSSFMLLDKERLLAILSNDNLNVSELVPPPFPPFVVR
jgi:hypothetical protein